MEPDADAPRFDASPAAARSWVKSRSAERSQRPSRGNQSSSDEEDSSNVISRSVKASRTPVAARSSVKTGHANGKSSQVKWQVATPAAHDRSLRLNINGISAVKIKSKKRSATETSSREAPKSKRINIAAESEALAGEERPLSNRKWKCALAKDRPILQPTSEKKIVKLAQAIEDQDYTDSDLLGMKKVFTDTLGPNATLCKVKGSSVEEHFRINLSKSDRVMIARALDARDIIIFDSAVSRHKDTGITNDAYHRIVRHLKVSEGKSDIGYELWISAPGKD